TEATTLAVMLSQPASMLDPREFAVALATERPQLYDKLSEVISTVHLPDHLSKAVENFNNYSTEDKQAIDRAVGERVIAGVKQKTGVDLSQAEIGDALGVFLDAKQHFLSSDEIREAIDLYYNARIQGVAPPELLHSKYPGQLLTWQTAHELASRL